MAAKPAGTPGRFFPWAIENPDTRRRIADRYAAGESAESLADIYGCSSRSIRRYAAEFGAAR